jgi:hypothetical protein
LVLLLTAAPLKELDFRAMFAWHAPQKNWTRAMKPTELRHDRTEQHHGEHAKVPTKTKMGERQLIVNWLATVCQHIASEAS